MFALIIIQVALAICGVLLVSLGAPYGWVFLGWAAGFTTCALISNASLEGLKNVRQVP